MNPEKTIVASYQYTIEEMLTTFSMHNLQVNHSKPKFFKFFQGNAAIVLIVFYTLIGGGRIYLDILEKKTLSFEHFFLFLMTLSGVFFLYLLSTKKKRIKRHFEARPDKNKTIQYTFNEDHVNIKIEEVDESSKTWAMFVKVVQTPKGFLLYSNDVSVNWLPYHAFKTNKDIDAVAQLAQKSISTYIEIS